MKRNAAGSPDEAAGSVAPEGREGHVSSASHYWRLLAVFAAAGLFYLLLRSVLIPESFGRDGHYRATAVDEIVAQEPLYQGPGSCAECHEKQVKQVQGEIHKTVSCELCHGPARGHLTQGEGRVPLEVNRTRQLCLGCHARVVGRPDTFPQIDVPTHQRENEFDEETTCVECHEGHEP